MATKQYTEEDRAEGLAGARACLAALRAIEGVSRALDRPDTAIEEYQQAKKVAADMLLRAVGETSPHTAGFLTALAEYVDFVNLMGTPNLASGGWVPDAAMTGREFAAHRMALEAIE